MATALLSSALDRGENTVGSTVDVITVGLAVVVIVHMPVVKRCQYVPNALFSAVEFEGLNTVDGMLVSSYTQPPLFEVEKDLAVHKYDLPCPSQRSS